MDDFDTDDLYDPDLDFMQEEDADNVLNEDDLDDYMDDELIQDISDLTF